MSNVKEITTFAGLKSEVVGHGRTVVLYSDPVSCVPCKALRGPYLEASDKEQAVNFIYINIREAEPELLSENNILGVPTIVYYRGDTKIQIDTQKLKSAKDIISALN